MYLLVVAMQLIGSGSAGIGFTRLVNGQLGAL